MSTGSYIIGLDIGTTSTKAVAFNPQGAVLHSHSIEYPIYQPHPNFAEQDPQEIVEAVLGSIGNVLAALAPAHGTPAAVGISCAMHSLIALDEQGHPITRAIIWADNRSSEEAQQLRVQGTGLPIYLRTGTPIHPMSPLIKLIWLRNHMNEIHQGAAKFVSIKEYLTFCLFHEYVVDYSMASATGLFNLQSLTWDSDALALAGIDSEKLSHPVPTTYVLQGMQPDYAEKMCIPSDTPFVIGASDGALANIGVGAIHPNQMAVTIGTSGAIRTMFNQPTVDEQQRTFCYYVTKDRWIVGGATNSGGILLRWLHDSLLNSGKASEEADSSHIYEDMINLASQVPAGAENLLFLPYLSGERAPYWNPDARGVFFGIGLHHQSEHFIRAVLEAVIFSIHNVSYAVQELTGPIQQIRASGGFARSPLWLQILADVSGKEVLVPASHQASALGAATLAMQALGWIGDIEQITDNIQIVNHHTPNSVEHRVYQQAFEKFRRVYDKLVDEF